MTDRPIRIRLEFRWRSLGHVRTDDDRRLLFPTAPRQPGLYRFRLSSGGTTRHYVGETDNLQRRFQNYRTPDPSQRTNIRRNAEFRDHIETGGSIDVDIASDGITVVAGDDPVCVDLADKATRRLLEHASLVDASAAGIALLNR